MLNSHEAEALSHLQSWKLMEVTARYSFPFSGRLILRTEGEGTESGGGVDPDSDGQQIKTRFVKQDPVYSNGGIGLTYKP
jgi:hypothetical protein